MRLSVIAACLSLCLIGFSAADDASASIRKETNIPAEGLGPALNALAKARNFQIVYVTEEIANVRTEGAVGEFTTEEALKRLLEGTGMTFRYLDDRTITIGHERSSSASQATSSGSSDDANPKEGKKRLFGEFRLAQVDQGKGSNAVAVANSPGNSPENSNSSSSALSEIIVTAQKREQRLLDVPISMVAIGSNELQQRQIHDLQDLQFIVPDLAVDSNGSQQRVYIRGIGPGRSPGDGVGEYIDEADVTCFCASGFGSLNLPNYDVQRVEVLRGPQGTLYGEGSVGGTIRFITNKPVLDKFEFGSDVAALFTQYGAPSQRVQTMANVPIIDNVLGVRVAGNFEHDGGWFDQPAANLKNINTQNLTDVRLEALWQPSSQFTVNAMQTIHRASYTPNMGEEPIGNFTQSFNLATTPTADKNYGISNVTMTYDFDFARLLSSTTYVKSTVEQHDWGYVIPIAGVVYDVYDPIYIVNDQRLNEELRLTGRANDPFQWTIGGFYRHAQDEFAPPTSYYFNLPGPLPSAPYPYTSNNWSKASAAFADASYEFLSRLTIGAGARYFKDDQTYATPGALTQAGSFHSVDPRFYLLYKISSGINVYASAAKGFRSGGFNSSSAVPTFGPESVWTYELGTKTLLLDGRLSFDVSVFRTDYQDLVVTGFTASNPININYNAAGARMRGIESDLRWTPLNQWTLSLNGNYIDAKITEVNVLGTGYQPGDVINDIPRYQATGSIQHDFSVNEKPAFARIDYSLTAPKVYGSPLGIEFGQTDYIHMLNLFSGVQWNQNLKFGFFAQNLLNDRGVLGGLAIQHLSERARPRTFGFNFGVNFD